MVILNKLNKISDKVFFKGKIFQKGKLLTNNEINSLLHKINSEQELLNLIPDFTGFFYLGIELEDNILLVTDIVRTYPIFYKISNHTIFICENGFDLKEDEEFSMHDVDEFLMCGYVIGNKTIFQNVFQVEAATLLSISKKDGKTVCDSYYSISPSSYLQETKENIFLRLNSIYEKVVQRLIDYAQGRTIVVPLSGGYDSRLLVMLLNRLGIKNVICYTYGSGYDIYQGEINISKKVAESLGYKWICISYSYSKWEKLFNSLEAEKYINYVSCGVSQIAYQEWLAVYELKNNRLIPDDSIIVPGHSGDFIAGSHIPENIKFDTIYEYIDVIKALETKHFDLFFLLESKRMQMCKSVLDLNLTTCTSIDFIDILETFDWKERQSKHICNSARVYEFCGYDWYFPLWDREIVDLWFSIHPKQRVGRALYKEFVENYFKTSIPYVSNGAKKNLFLRIIFKIFKVLKIDFLVNNQYGIAKINKLSLFFKEISVSNELIDSFVLNNCSKKLRKASVNGIGALQALLFVIHKK